MKFDCYKRATYIRGDDDAILVALKDGRQFTTGDKAIFMLRDDQEAIDDLVKIESTDLVPYNDVENAAIHITIPGESMIGFDLDSNYWYTILLVWADGKNVTVIPPTKFKLLPGGRYEVTP